MRSVLYVLGDVETTPWRRWRRRRCRELAAGHGYRPRFVASRYGAPGWREHLVERVRAAVGDGTRLVVVLGGDGTISACAQAAAHSDTVLALVPCGSANAFARSLGVPFGLDAALQTAFGGFDRPVDVALVDGRVVLTVAGIGLDAVVVAATPAVPKRVLGWLGYGLAAVPHLWDGPHAYRVSVDGEPAIAVSARTIAVANAATFPLGLTLSRSSRPDDGLLEVAVLNPVGVLGWALLARQMARASPRRASSARLFAAQARSVTITADSTLPRQLDGDPITSGSELQVQIAPGALTVRRPTG